LARFVCFSAHRVEREKSSDLNEKKHELHFANCRFGKKAQEIASKHGFRNLLQPGLVKELIIADMLGHDVHTTKHEPDAYDPNDPNLKYEYLSCFENGTF
jgi:hypothetical protein